MKILFLPSYFAPEKAASLYIADNRYEAFANEGFDMVAYTPFPSRGLSKEDIARWRKVPKEVLYNGKMMVSRFPLSSESTSSFKRIVRYFVQNVMQYRWARKRKNIEGVDAIFVASTPPLHGYMASCLSKKHGIPFVYNVQDVFPDSLVGTGLAKKNGILWNLCNRIENKTYARAAKIVVISQDFKNNLIAKGVPEEKIEIIYNWVDEQAVHPIPNEENPFFEQFNLSRDKFTVVYAGNFGNAQNINIILDAARMMPDIQFALFGTGGLEEEIRKKIESNQLTNVKLNPLQPYEKVSNVYSLGNACVVSCKAGLGGSAMPSKTWSIMSCARPVLANFDEGELRQIIENNRCGVFTKAGDVQAFVDAIRSLAANPTLCEEMGKNARQFIMNNLTKKVGTKKYVDIIKTVVKKLS